MRSGLFFLSVGLLALGAKLQGSSGQNVTASEGTIILGCKVKTSASGIVVSWLHNGEAVGSSFDSASDPVQEGNSQIIYRMLVMNRMTWGTHDYFTCLVRLQELPSLMDQKTTDKDRGNPSASLKTIFGPRFQDNQTDIKSFISCLVIGLRRLGVSIKWQENGGPLPEGTDVIDSGPEDPYLLTSTLEVDEVPENTSCTIGDEQLEILKIREKTPVKNEGHPYLRV